MSRTPSYRRRFDDLLTASQMPDQQIYSAGRDPGFPPPFLEMGDPRADECIVRDISPHIEAASWRWTYLSPTLRFYLQERKDLRFSMEFTIVETAFQQTGPVTLSCYIDDQLLTKTHCPHAGNYHLEEGVPDSWLQSGNPVIVRAVLDKVSTAPTGGVRLGYVLLRAGFQRGHR